MAKKKRKRAQPPESPIAGFLRRHRKWPRRLGVTAGLVAVLAAIWFFADPFGGTPTAIDENGVEVNAGPIDWEGSTAQVRGQAQNFLLPDYDKQAVRLDEFAGKAVFVNFWASWCEPCLREMPNIIQIAEEFPDDVVVIAINRGEPKGTATNWTRANNFREDLPNFYWLLDERESVWRKYSQGNGMPQSFFLDSDGIIRRDVSGGLEYGGMLDRIELALAFGRPDASAE